jgi:CHAT domain-containing protein
MNRFLFQRLWQIPAVLFYISSPGFSQLSNSESIQLQVDSLIQVSRKLTLDMQYDKALQLMTDAEQLVVNGIGTESKTYADICFNRGRIYKFNRKNDEAEKWYLESLKLRERFLGNQHPDYAWSLNNLAAIYLEKGQYQKSEKFYLQSKKIRETHLGSNHPEYASSLNNLANLYVRTGRYEEAESLYIQSRKIREQFTGKDIQSQSANLNNLANLYVTMGNYDKAEPIYLEVKELIEKELTIEHPSYRICINNLATIYMELGIYDKSEQLYLEADDIQAKLVGKDHPDYASSINNLAILYLRKGTFQKAESLYLEAKVIRETKLGKLHPEYAASITGLADLYVEIKKFKEAESLYIEAKTLREKLFGNLHPDYAWNLAKLANCYYRSGQYTLAEKPLLEAKEIRKNTLGENHPDYSEALKSLFELYRAMGIHEKAEQTLLEFSQFDRKFIMRATQHLSEVELNKYLARYSEMQSKMYSYVLERTQTGKQNILLAGLCYDNVLFLKGFLLNASIRLKQLASRDKSTVDLYNEFRSIGRRLAIEYAKPVNKQSQVAELESRSDELEKIIARKVSEHKLVTKQVNWEDIRNKLTVGEAAIEFIHFNHYDSKTKKTDTHYAALIIKSALDPQVAIEFIELFKESSLDTLLNDRTERRSDYVNNLYSINDRGATSLKSPQRSLYEIIWKPLQLKLDGITKIYFAPTGLLHRINLGAIAVADEKILNDKYKLVSMTSTRNFYELNEQYIIVSRVIQIYGGIKYDLDSTIIHGFETKDSQSSASIIETSRGGAWNYLKWTEKEASLIAGICKQAGYDPDLRLGYAATETSFKNSEHHLQSPFVLHIATHGYFIPDGSASKNNLTEYRDNPFIHSTNPMMRSGLIFSGGNYAWNTGNPPYKGMDDGILTAYEISKVDMDKTSLVVLSACETGLGDLIGNEGVYGLQRAFKIAGVNAIIMSLWQIPDQETKEFMVSFYKNWLDKRLTIREAFRITQQEMRERFINPYQWAGFVLVE